MRRARVIGAGLSGLAAAWRLVDAGFDVEVFESGGEFGGLIGTTHTPHGLVERGANAFLWTDTADRWFRELDLSPVFPLPANRRRYIFRDGRARRWPLTVGETLAGAARAGAAWSRGVLWPVGEESVATWADRALGRSPREWLVAPALQGIYGADPEQLAANAIFGGSRNNPRASRRRRPVSVAPGRGMGEFIDRLVTQLQARGATLSRGVAIHELAAGMPTVLATDHQSAARLLTPHAPGLARTLAAIPATTVASATAFFEPHSSDLQGFGVLFPRQAGVRALGVLFNTSIFDERGAWRSETWIYGSSGEIPADDELAAAIARDREQLTGRTTRPVSLVFDPEHKRPRATLPVYGPALLRARDHLPELPPWIALAGNYLGRLGVARLLDVAEEAARRLSR